MSGAAQGKSGGAKPPHIPFRGAKFGFGTRAVHAGQEPDPSTGAIMTPVYMTSTFVQEYPAKPKNDFDYARTKNPTRTALEGNLAALENGAWGLCFSSGMGAINTVLNLFESGDHVIAGNDLYGGTYRIFMTLYKKFGMSFSFVDTTKLAEIEKALTPKTKMIYVETPSNPLLRVTDLAAVAKLAKKKKILSVCDNTFATPALQRPLEHGFDLVLHSTTKYMGGHSDVVGGALLGKDEELWARLKHFQNAVGAVPGPMDCFLVLRGTKTLHLRMQRHCENGIAVAKFLEKHPKVSKVYYPGLPSHPQHAVAKKQMYGFGGMVSFELKGGVEEGIRVITATKIFSLAESLGGVESLVDHPVSMTHGSIPAEERRKAGLSDGLIRLSVGVEEEADLLHDLQEALKKA